MTGKDFYTYIEQHMPFERDINFLEIVNRNLDFCMFHAEHTYSVFFIPLKDNKIELHIADDYSSFKVVIAVDQIQHFTFDDAWAYIVQSDLEIYMHIKL